MHSFQHFIFKLCVKQTDLILVDVGYFFYTTLYDITVTQKDYYTTLQFHITTADISTNDQWKQWEVIIGGFQLSPFGGRKSPWNERASSININVQFEKLFGVFGVFVNHLDVRWKVFTALTSIFFF